MVAFLGKQLDPRKQSVCLQAEKGAVMRVGQKKKKSKMHYLRRQQGGKAPATREDKRMLLFGVWG